jgi:RNA polymerase sigma factor (sigma-70 family)
VGIDALPLRTQSDRRLVRLVREGYESAFEEIVRRYRRPLDRFAASLVGGRSEDVTQDSFRKALIALRRDDDEIDLRPWLYRIVRNTALNDLRDRPPAAAELADDLIAGGRSAAAVAEQRAEVAALTARLRALPPNQRAALVMRELEGMSHDQIAATLGITHGAARQAIARARTTVRNSLGALIPLPLLRVLASGSEAGTEAAVSGGAAAGGVGAAGGAEAAAGGAGAAVTGAGAAAGGAAGGTGAAAAGAGATAGGASGIGASLFGGGAALKVGLATVVVAGGIGAGVAIDHHGGGNRQPKPEAAVRDAPTPSRTRALAPPSRASTPSPAPARALIPVAEDASAKHPGSSGKTDRHGRDSAVEDSHRARHGSDHGGGDDHLIEGSVAAEPTIAEYPAVPARITSDDGGNFGPTPKTDDDHSGRSGPGSGHGDPGPSDDSHSGSGSRHGGPGSNSGSGPPGSGDSRSGNSGSGTSGSGGSGSGHTSVPGAPGSGDSGSGRNSGSGDSGSRHGGGSGPSSQSSGSSGGGRGADDAHEGIAEAPPGEVAPPAASTESSSGGPGPSATLDDDSDSGGGGTDGGSGSGSSGGSEISP